MKSCYLAYGVLTALAATLTGCSTTGLFKFRDTIPQEGRHDPAVRILTLWQPAEGRWENRTTRGGSGQILFFGATSNAAMQVDGEAEIEVFDDQGTPEEQAKPIHRFKFSAAAWKAHLVKGPLGVTYDVFIPYTRKGIHEAKMTLLVRYTPKDGQPLNSELIDVPLEGTKKQKSEEPIPLEYGHDSRRPGDADARNVSSKGDTADRRHDGTNDWMSSIIGPEQLDKARGKRVDDAPLTAAEQKRILREARAKLGQDPRTTVVTTAYEEPAAEETDDENPQSVRQAAGDQEPRRLRPVNSASARQARAAESEDEEDWE